MSNSITSLRPYRTRPGWAFDDPARGLHREAFVAGADTLLDVLAGPETETCVLTFSAIPYPGHQHAIRKVSADGFGGTTYQHEGTGHTLWLCPALLKYFDIPPERIFFGVSGVKTDPTTSAAR